jgi:hypothetical protein
MATYTNTCISNHSMNSQLIINVTLILNMRFEHLKVGSTTRNLTN